MYNIYHAVHLDLSKVDPFQTYLNFQKKWEEMMGIIGEKREAMQPVVFG